MSRFLRGVVRGLDPRRDPLSCLAAAIVGLSLPAGLSARECFEVVVITAIVIVALRPLYGESHTPDKKEKP